MGDADPGGKGKRIGIFGGTFDPPHVAHIVCASSVAALTDLDQVILTVAGDPYQKETVAGAEDRYQMTLLAAEGDPELSVSRIEIDREGPTYTIDTVRAIRAANPDCKVYLIGGSDAFSGFRTWHQAEELVRAAAFIVLPRSSASVRQAFESLGDGADIVVPEGLPTLDISSTDVRARLAEGLPVGHLIASKVADYIHSKGLYSD